MFDLTDTISAISTPPGEGGIGIVRMSGPASLSIAKKIFTAPKGESLNGIESHKVIYGFITDIETGKKIDEVLLTIMYAPRSFTREDTVEISCHGGSLPLQRILSLTLKNGARIAEPGEFTKRAFLNGRINLIQAEAVIDIIKSGSDLALESAMMQLQGGLSKKIASIRDILINVLSEIEACIDFPEEDIEFRDQQELREKLEATLNDIEQLIDTYRYGKIYREGVSVVIAGRPNVGKSSLMNALLNEERSIVTSIAGTTRDTIEEEINIHGMMIRIVDTAGIRESEGFIEQEGIRRARSAIERAGLVIFLLDGSEGLDEIDVDLIKDIQRKNKPVIVAVNKIDIGDKISPHNSSPLWEGYHGEGEFLRISALRGVGLDELKNRILKMIYHGSCKIPESPFITRERHKELLLKAGDFLRRAIQSIHDNISLEFIASEIRFTLESIGEITGETYSDDVLDRIFQEFCIGK
ncbi:MAG: tRNA uridine-5-carboxymethylaminomethyl(34) synthesis GTPase MnmE [Nitrospinota bacterium]